MTAIITGDIINSRRVNSGEWINKLSALLATIGERPKTWDIYRGDSFQIQIAPEESLKTALIIKSLIKTNKTLDVRMSIGIGEISYSSDKITESNGSAYINSGESFDNLKKYSLNIKTPFEEINDYFGAIFKLISFIADEWKPATAETIHYSLINPELTQKELSFKLNKKSSGTVNAALKRGGYNEIIVLLDLFNIKVKKYV